VFFIKPKLLAAAGRARLHTIEASKQRRLIPLNIDLLLSQTLIVNKGAEKPLFINKVDGCFMVANSD